MSDTYYSALDKEDKAINYPAVDFFKHDGSMAFKYNIEAGFLPAFYDDTDVLYSEPAWRDGYGKFMDYSGDNATDYENYTHNINKVIQSNKQLKPIVLLCGATMQKKLITPDWWAHSKINGGDCRVLGYNISQDWVDTKTHYTIMHSLAQKFDRVGDFCCGFGNTARIFTEHGKDFVVSDVNPRCIGYIKEYYENI